MTKLIDLLGMTVTFHFLSFQVSFRFAFRGIMAHGRYWALHQAGSPPRVLFSLSLSLVALFGAAHALGFMI